MIYIWREHGQSGKDFVENIKSRLKELGLEKEIHILSNGTVR